jgi:hypothetical protein
MRDREERKRGEKKKWRFEISTWMGKAHEGYWVRVTVATNLKRSYTHHTRSKSMENRGEIVTEKVEEICYAHQGYRPKFEDEADTRKAFYFRGARVWRK